MTAKEILDRTAQFFTELMQPAQDASGTPAAPQKMMEAKLKDGTVVEVTDMNVGGVVTIAGTPAPVGEHELEDGTKIVLVDNGVISEIIMPQAAPAPAMPPMEDMSAKFAAFESATNEKFASYENKFAEYEVKLSEAWDSNGLELPEGVEMLSQTATSFKVRVDRPQESNPQILKSLSATSASVMAFQEEPRTLEQVYLKAMMEAKGHENVQ